jgi:hypothetical protein
VLFSLASYLYESAASNDTMTTKMLAELLQTNNLFRGVESQLEERKLKARTARSLRAQCSSSAFCFLLLIAMVK